MQSFRGFTQLPTPYGDLYGAQSPVGFDHYNKHCYVKIHFSPFFSEDTHVQMGHCM